MTTKKTAPIKAKIYPREKTLDGKTLLPFKVWKICDKLKASLKRIPSRAEVAKECNKFHLKESAYTNQFYFWRRFNGITRATAVVNVMPKAIAKPVAKAKASAAPKPAAKLVALIKEKPVATIKPKEPAKPKPAAKPKAPAKPKAIAPKVSEIQVDFLPSENQVPDLSPQEKAPVPMSDLV